MYGAEVTEGKAMARAVSRAQRGGGNIAVKPQCGFRLPLLRPSGREGLFVAQRVRCIQPQRSGRRSHRRGMVSEATRTTERRSIEKTAGTEIEPSALTRELAC